MKMMNIRTMKMSMPTVINMIVGDGSLTGPIAYWESIH